MKAICPNCGLIVEDQNADQIITKHMNDEHNYLKRHKYGAYN